MYEIYVFYGTLAISWLEFAWSQYLSMRQRNVYKITEMLTEKVSTVTDVETFNKAKTYNIAKINFVAVKDWLNMLAVTACMCLNGITFAWNLSKLSLANTQYSKNEIAISCVFFTLINGVVALGSTAINAYENFVIENQHGYHKQTLGQFVKTEIKRFGMSQLVKLPYTIATVSIVKLNGPFTFAWLYLLVLLNQMFASAVYHSWVAPMAGNFKPLGDCPLKTKIKELADQVKFKLSDVYINDDVSLSNTGHGDVSLYGLTRTKTIVLSKALFQQQQQETKPAAVAPAPETDKKKAEEAKVKFDKSAKTDGVKKMSDDEIVALVARELGHWKKGHDSYENIFFQIDLMIKTFAFGWLHDNATIYRSFGYHESPQPVTVGLAIMYLYVLYPYGALVSYARAAMGAALERQADGYAKSVGKGKALTGALVKLNNMRLTFPVEDGWYASWCAGRPRLMDRLDALNAVEPVAAAAAATTTTTTTTGTTTVGAATTEKR